MILQEKRRNLLAMKREVDVELEPMDDLLTQILSKRSKRDVDFDRNHVLHGILAQLYEVEVTEALIL